MKELIKRCSAEDFHKSVIQPIEDTVVYEVSTNTLILTYWNSNNKQKINHDEVLNEIALLLLDDDSICEGRVSDNFNEIMFEVKEKI